MARVVLVRHGHPLIKGTVPPRWQLSREGRKAASTLAQRDVWQSVERIYSSPEPKAQETAEIVATARNVPMEVLDDLREVERPYEVQGYDDKIRAFLYEGSSPGWEKRENAEARITHAIQETARPGVDVAAVSHALLLTLFVARVTGVTPTFWLHHAIGFAEYAIYDGETGTITKGFRGT